MRAFNSIAGSLLHFLFPHICEGCGTDSLSSDSALCMRCINELPTTGFCEHADNPVEKKFWGRVPVSCAMAQYYFTPRSLLQRLMHQLKYKDAQMLGHQFGRLMGDSLRNANWSFIDALIPLPLHSSREKVRGYNQAGLLCEGIAEKLGVPILHDAVIRPDATATQTRKSRIERWQNIEGRFLLHDPGMIRHKHVLLVDDVITTGATLEACATELIKAEGTRLSIASLAFAIKT